jgi:hypothetical protein
MVLVLCSFTYLFPEISEKPKPDYKKPIILTPLYLPDIPETPESLHPEFFSNLYQNQNLLEHVHELSQEEKEELEFVFQNSPIEAQYITNHLQDPDFFSDNQDYRSTIFVGEPGTGKTTMAKAIAYKMSQHGWEYKIMITMENEFKKILALLEKLNPQALNKIVPCSDIQKEYRRINDLQLLDVKSIKHLNLLKSNQSSIDEIMKQICHLDVFINTYLWHVESIQDITEKFIVKNSNHD